VVGGKEIQLQVDAQGAARDEMAGQAGGNEQALSGGLQQFFLAQGGKEADAVPATKRFAQTGKCRSKKDGGSEMKWGILILAIFVFHAGSGKLFATEEWERKLMEDGWVKVEENFLTFANTTWYGQMGKRENYEFRVFYIDPSGKKAFFQFFKGAKTYIGNRDVRMDGVFCVLFKSFHFEKQCNRTMWKKGTVFMRVSGTGEEIGVWKIKKGNLENFSLAGVKREKPRSGGETGPPR